MSIFRSTKEPGDNSPGWVGPELTIFGISLGTAIALSKITNLPTWANAHPQAQLFFGVFVFLAMYTFLRVVLLASLISRRKSPGLRLVLTFASVFVTSLFYISVNQTFAQRSQVRLSDLMQIERSDFSVELDCYGNATVTRQQTIVPFEQLNRIPETDFYSSGDLSDSNFSVEIRRFSSDGNGEVIPSRLTYDKYTRRVINTIDGDNILAKGSRYTRRTTIVAHGAFRDTIGDAFFVNISYQTNGLEINLRLVGGCQFDSLRCEKLKEGGRLLDRPDQLTILNRVDGTQAKVFVENPKPGDQYALIWKYRSPPRSIPRT